METQGRDERQTPAVKLTPEESELIKEKLKELNSELRRLETNYERLQSLDTKPVSEGGKENG